MMYRYFITAFILVNILACGKKGTLDENYWEAREAGAYQVTSATCSIYVNDVLVKDSTIDVGKSYILLLTTETGGWYNDLDLYGDWIPPIFGQGNNYLKVWNMENDDRRISFSYYVNYTFTAACSLTVDEIGKTKQKWHLIQNTGSTYKHYIFNMERVTKPE